jgi:hypothetical protein
VLQAFVDDSLDSHKNFFVLGGFISTVENWMEFAHEWEKVCAQDPVTPDFHMVKAHRLREYRWTEAQRDKRVKELCDLIRAKALYRVSAVTASHDFDQIVKGRVPKEFDSPYFLLFYAVLFATSRLLNKLNADKKVDFVFDDQSKLGLNALSVFDLVKKNAPELFSRTNSTPIFRHDKDVLALKGADIFSWIFRRYFEKGDALDTVYQERMDEIFSMYGAEVKIEHDDMKEFVSRITDGLQLTSKIRLHIPKAAA